MKRLAAEYGMTEDPVVADMQRLLESLAAKATSAY